MKVSRRDLSLIMIIVGLLVAFLSYQFVFKPSMDERDKVKEEREALDKQYADLKPVLDNQQQYATTIENTSEKLGELVKKFPAAYLYEDAILYLRDLEKKDNLSVFFETFSITESTLMDNYTGLVGQETKTYILGNSTIATTFTLGNLEDEKSGYKDMKTLISTIYADSKPKNIDTVILNFNNLNGMVTGSMLMNMYSLMDGTNAYEEPTMPNVPVGLENGVFGAVVTPIPTIAIETPEE